MPSILIAFLAAAFSVASASSKSSEARFGALENAAALCVSAFSVVSPNTSPNETKPPWEASRLDVLEACATVRGFASRRSPFTADMARTCAAVCDAFQESTKAFPPNAPLVASAKACSKACSAF
ncbi:MAG: hypothetical protein IOD12_15545 [Silvanigrellales bacterium]|jgi:hypothetical protein|nr:hypothetical protein [Silvanigrellales bacterium]